MNRKLIIILLTINSVGAQTNANWSLKLSLGSFLPASKSKYHDFLINQGSEIKSNLLEIGLNRSMINKPKFGYELGVKTIRSNSKLTDVVASYTYFSNSDHKEYVKYYNDKPDCQITAWDFSIVNQFQVYLPTIWDRQHFLEGHLDFSIVKSAKLNYTTSDTLMDFSENFEYYNQLNKQIDFGFSPTLGTAYNFNLLKNDHSKSLFLRVGINFLFRQLNIAYLYNSYWSVGLNYRWSKTKKEAIE